MADFGIKWAKSNAAITDEEQKLAMTSKRPMFKIFLAGNGSLVLPAGQETVSIDVTHNLGFRPAFFIYAEEVGFGGTLAGVHLFFNINLHLASTGFVYGISKTNVLTIKVYWEGGPVSDTTYNYRYYVLTDKLD